MSCPSCHRVKEVSPTGTVLWKASTETCLDCHDPQAASRLESYHATLRAALTEMDAMLASVREALQPPS